MYYSEKPIEELSAFEKARRILLCSAYNRAVWECIVVSQEMYLKFKKRRIEFYNVVIQECYSIIRKLKKGNKIK